LQKVFIDDLDQGACVLSPTQIVFYSWHGYSPDGICPNGTFRMYDTDTKTMTKLSTNISVKFSGAAFAQIGPDKFVMWEDPDDADYEDYIEAQEAEEAEEREEEFVCILFDKTLKHVQELRVPLGKNREYNIYNFSAMSYGNGYALISARNIDTCNLCIKVLDIAKNRVVYETCLPNAHNIVDTRGRTLYVNYHTHDENDCRVRTFVLPDVCAGEEYVREFTTRNADMFEQLQYRMFVNKIRYGTHALNGQLAVPVAALRTIHSFL
jgi:hypothetical protein